MISTIIVGGNLNERATYLNSLITPSTNLLHLTPAPSSIGIGEIKTLLRDLTLTTSVARVVWIEEANTLTLEASNALLKLLEEPPNNTTLYLTCPSASSLLPTIRSRCQLHTLSQSRLPNTSLLPTLKPLFALTSGDRLTHLTDFPSDRTELLVYFASLANELNHTINTTPNSKSYQLLATLSRLTLELHLSLSRNVNPTLALSHFLLHLPHTR